MPVTTWNQTTINGKNYLVIEVAQFRIPLDWAPDSNMFIAVAAPNGGVGNFPALHKGDPGDPAALDSVINFTALAASDSTPDSASFTELSPGLWQLNLALHKGADGADGSTTLNPSSFGTPVFKKILRVDSALTGFEYQTQLVGERYIPATIASTPSGNSAYTLCSVGVPALDFDWRPEVSGWCVVTGTAADVQVDLIARLNSETAGNEVGRASQPSGQYPATHVLSSGPPAGSADTYDKVLAGNSATIYLRAERQSGGSTFTTSSSTTRFKVRVQPVP